MLKSKKRILLVLKAIKDLKAQVSLPQAHLKNFNKQVKTHHKFSLTLL